MAEKMEETQVQVSETYSPAPGRTVRVDGIPATQVVENGQSHFLVNPGVLDTVRTLVQRAVSASPRAEQIIHYRESAKPAVRANQGVSFDRFLRSARHLISARPRWLAFAEWLEHSNPDIEFSASDLIRIKVAEGALAGSINLHFRKRTHTALLKLVEGNLELARAALQIASSGAIERPFTFSALDNALTAMQMLSASRSHDRSFARDFVLIIGSRTIELDESFHKSAIRSRIDLRRQNDPSLQVSMISGLVTGLFPDTFMVEGSETETRFRYNPLFRSELAGLLNKFVVVSFAKHASELPEVIDLDPA